MPGSETLPMLRHLLSASPAEVIAARHEVTDGKPTARFVVNMVRDGTRLSKEVTEAITDLGHQPTSSTLYLREAYRQSIGEGATVYQTKNTTAQREVDNLRDELLEVMA